MNFLALNDELYYILYYSFQVLRVYFYIMIVTIILSWTPLRNTGFYTIMDKISSVYLRPFRGWLVIGQLDLTPMFGLIIFQIILSFISRAI